MKRKPEFFYHTRSKKHQAELFPGLSPVTRKRTLRQGFFVSGTDVRNYLINDPLVDWLKIFRREGRTRDNQEFVSFIMNKGREFETSLIKYLRENKTPIVSISDRITPESCNQTKLLMEQGVPVIHSAPFQDKKKGIQGVIDLLVRSDCLHLLTGENPLPPDTQKAKAEKLKGDYHYVVVDIKFSTLPLRADGTHILNSGSYPAYKGQLWIYTNGIASIQGYLSQYAFLLGRRWCYTSKGERYAGLNCLEKLGTIDFLGVDSEYIPKTTKAMEWIKDVKTTGKSWEINPPSRVELYPNMCVNSGEWQKEKQKIAEQIGDITQLWYCGVKHREEGLKKGITSWRDPRCSSKAIGMGGVRAPIVDKIIEINRQNQEKILPKKVKNNLFSWKNKCNEVFVDFETFCDIFSEDIPDQEKTDQIFMIGVYYKKPYYGDEPCSPSYFWEYRSFVIREATLEEEYRILDEFASFVRDLGKPKMWYWHADQRMWDKAENKHADLAIERGDWETVDRITDSWKLGDWTDLCCVFREEPIVIKGCFKFGLKEIASAMKENRLIRTTWTSECKSGLDASVKAWNVYHPKGDEEEKVRVTDPENHPVLKDIEKYNLADVVVLKDILFYLRANHI